MEGIGGGLKPGRTVRVALGWRIIDQGFERMGEERDRVCGDATVGTLCETCEGEGVAGAIILARWGDPCGDQGVTMAILEPAPEGEPLLAEHHLEGVDRRVFGESLFEEGVEAFLEETEFEMA